MKKILGFVVTVLVIASVSAVVLAKETLGGTVVKIEKAFVTVQDSETGDEFRVHMDKSTKINGELKQDALVEVEVDNGHAVSITVAEKSMKEGSEG